MNTELQKSQAVFEQLADLTQTLEKEKVQLTPEVEEYVRSHVRAVQDKLQAGEDVHQSDLEFIEKVKMWILMPKELREKYRSVNEMVKSDEFEDIKEANKRNISLQQWLDLLHVAKAKVEQNDWIDETFKFPGKGKIKAKGDLWLGGCTGLTELPEGLNVGEGLDLTGCTGLTELPEGLNVGEGLDLTGCTGLTKLSEGLKVGRDLWLGGCTGLTELPEGLKVGDSLNLGGCTGLTELPEGLSVGWHLDLEGCTSLTKLPEELRVGHNLYLSESLNEQVKKNAEKLKVEGKIKGEIIYV